MDVGVHYADMIVYLMGPVDRVAGITRLLEPVRTTGRIDESPSGMYARFRADLPDTFEATAPDSLQAMLGFASGAAGTWGLELSAPDAGQHLSAVLGSEGRLETLRGSQRPAAESLARRPGAARRRRGARPGARLFARSHDDGSIRQRPLGALRL